MTTMTSTTANQKRRSVKQAIQLVALVGLLAGSLDILAAFINAYIAKGVLPALVLRYIASGLFGKEAFTGGSIMVVSGLLFHFVIAYSFTIFFFYAYPHLKFLSKNVFITAIAMGIFIYVVMTWMVLPLTKLPPITFHLDKAALAILILTVVIGLPVSFFAKKHYSQK